jgi:hypothetical protein
MKKTRRLSRRLLGSSLLGVVMPKQRRSLFRRAMLAAAVVGPVLYLAHKRRKPMRPASLRERLFTATQTGRQTIDLSPNRGT